MTATRRTPDESIEYVILVDDQDNAVGLAEKLEAHEKGLLHRAFSVFIYRHAPRFEILLQQRALHKYHSPGLWTNTCCSHPRDGETVVAAAERRLREEMGITASLQDLGWFKYHAGFPNGLSEHEIDHVLTGEFPYAQTLAPNPDEVHACRWVSLTELAAEMAAAPGNFTPWLPRALAFVKAQLASLTVQV